MTYADGTTQTITTFPGQMTGATDLIGRGAPVGTFIPAGTPASLPNYYSGADMPDQPRFFTGQTGTMYLRQ